MQKKQRLTGTRDDNCYKLCELTVKSIAECEFNYPSSLHYKLEERSDFCKHSISRAIHHTPPYKPEQLANGLTVSTIDLTPRTHVKRGQICCLTWKHSLVTILRRSVKKKSSQHCKLVHAMDAEIQTPWITKYSDITP